MLILSNPANIFKIFSVKSPWAILIFAAKYNQSGTDAPTINFLSHSKTNIYNMIEMSIVKVIYKNNGIYE